MRTKYKVIIKDTPQGIACYLYGKYLFWWIRIDGLPAMPRTHGHIINSQIDDWDKLLGGPILIDNQSQNFILEF